MKKVLFITIFLLWFQIIYTQVPNGYYDAASGLQGEELRTALHNIIKNPSVTSYSGLWNAFYSTDKKPNGKVWDMYSDIPGGTPAYEYTFGTNQCGNYNSEGDCYNREHSVPASWFSDQAPMYSDLFHLYPTDGYVNNRRSNYPFGKVASASWISTNGSKLGSSGVPGYTGTVFEPIDDYKGDFARTYFYMVTCYMDKVASWSSPMFSGNNLSQWAINMLLQWHQNDPVSEKEINRNNAVYNIQNNRNPYIDNPVWALAVWDPNYVPSFADFSKISFSIFPNPFNEYITITLNHINTNKIVVYIINVSGNTVKTFNLSNLNYTINTADLPNGIYFIKIIDVNYTSIQKLVKSE